MSEEDKKEIKPEGEKVADIEDITNNGQSNRDENNVGEDNSKINAGKDDYADDQDHVGDKTVDAQSQGEGDTSADTGEEVRKEDVQFVNSSDFDLQEDLDAIFGNSEGLSEEFKNKTQTIFTAAVVAKTNHLS